MATSTFDIFRGNPSNTQVNGLKKAISPSTGSGELEVKLFNYRQPHGYEARYFRKGAVPEAGSQAHSLALPE